MSSSLASSSTSSPSKINNIRQHDSSSSEVGRQPQEISSRNNKNNGRRTLPKLVVHVKRVLSEESLQVHVKRFGKIQLIKKKIKKMTGIPIIDQTLVLSGRQLENNEKIISLLGTPDVAELTVFLVCKNPKKPIENTKKNEAKSNESVPPPPSIEEHLDVEEISSTESIQEEQDQTGEGIIEKLDEESITPLLQDVSPFSFSSLVVVKITYEGQHRRIPMEGTSFSRLTSLCTTFFGIKNVNRMILRYQDEDGDLVQLSSDYELAYALATQACPSKRSGTPVLRFLFSVKPVHPKFPPINTPSSSSIINSNDTNISPKEEKTINSSTPSEMRRLRDGDLIQLSNGGFNVVLTPSQQVNKNNKNELSNKFLIEGRKDDDSEASQWIVKKAQLGGKNKKKLVHKNLSEEKEEQEKKRQVIFLRNKTLSNTNKNLRITPTGELQHTGACGKWARFVVRYLPNEGTVQLRSIGRSLLRDIETSSSSFLGIVPEQKAEQKKKNNKNQVVKGTFKKNDDASKFTLRFVQ